MTDVSHSDKPSAARECAEYRMVSVSEAEIKQLYELIFGSWPFRDYPNREYMQDAIRAIQAGWKPIETAPPAHKFLMERCWYWVPVIDDESLPPDGWKGVVEAETKRGHIEYRQAEYTKPLFGGKPEWSAWTFREEGDWKPLRWLKKWDIPLLSAAPENADEQS